MRGQVSRILRMLFGAMPLVLGVALVGAADDQQPDTFDLPAPSREGEVSVEQTLADRRSERSFTSDPLGIDALSQLLWATQGVTQAETGFRTAPSAGATYPLEVWVAVGSVEGLEPGTYRYLPEEHALALRRSDDQRDALARAALGQMWIADAPVVVVLTAVYERTTSRYGPRGERYVHMEVGHAAQNLYLQAEALGLGTVTVGAFDDASVQEVLDTHEAPMAILPVGIPAN